MPGLFGLLVILVATALAGAFGCSKEEEQDRASLSPSGAENAMNEKRTQARNDERPETPPAIVFLGDSLTAGRGLSERDAYPALIEQRLEESGSHHQVINAGRSGDTTAGGLGRLDWYLKDRVNPEVLVIFLGSNDAMRGVSLRAMEQNLRGIIGKARAFRPGMALFLVELHTFPNMGASYGDEFQELFSRVADEEKVHLIEFPLSEVAGRSELNQPDGIHPNRRGTRKVAEKIWQSLAAHLSK